MNFPEILPYRLQHSWASIHILILDVGQLWPKTNDKNTVPKEQSEHNNNCIGPACTHRR